LRRTGGGGGTSRKAQLASTSSKPKGPLLPPAWVVGRLLGLREMWGEVTRGWSAAAEGGTPLVWGCSCAVWADPFRSVPAYRVGKLLPKVPPRTLAMQKQQATSSRTLTSPGPPSSRRAEFHEAASARTRRALHIGGATENGVAIVERPLAAASHGSADEQERSRRVSASSGVHQALGAGAGVRSDNFSLPDALAGPTGTRLPPSPSDPGGRGKGAKLRACECDEY
jgi:hypothetical protein